MNIKESELRKKLDLVVDKLLNLGGPDNAKELEESGGEAIGFFARDFGIREWDWPQGVGLYGLLKIMQYDKNEKYKEFLHDWFVENMELGLPSRNINTTTPLLTLAELNEYYHDEKFEKLCLDWADWLMNCIPRTKEGGFQHVTSANGDRQGVRLNESEMWIDTLFMTVLFLNKMDRNTRMKSGSMKASTRCSCTSNTSMRRRPGCSITAGPSTGTTTSAGSSGAAATAGLPWASWIMWRCSRAR